MKPEKRDMITIDKEYYYKMKEDVISALRMAIGYIPDDKYDAHQHLRKIIKEIEGKEDYGL